MVQQLLVSGRLEAGARLVAFPKLRGKQCELFGTLQQSGAIVADVGGMTESLSGFCAMAISRARLDAKCNGWTCTFLVNADGSKTSFDELRSDLRDAAHAAE